MCNLNLEEAHIRHSLSKKLASLRDGRIPLSSGVNLFELHALLPGELEDRIPEAAALQVFMDFVDRSDGQASALSNFADVVLMAMEAGLKRSR